MKKARIALAGNPNSGKTTLFNGLTGARQHVGNYPGVTVEKKVGCFHTGEWTVEVTDLPGIYSMTAFSPEELIARNVILAEQPDVIVDILDASNLERNLYLATQFMELGLPLLLVMNMSDVAKARGYSINGELLSRLLGVPIVETVGHREQGLEELKQAIVGVLEDRSRAIPREVSYGRTVNRYLQQLLPILEADGSYCAACRPRWLAIKLLENDSEVATMVREASSAADDILSSAAAIRGKLETEYGEPSDMVVADTRYGFISGACQEAVQLAVEARHSRSDSIDALMTHRVLGIPIFLGLLYAVFKLTFSVGAPLVDLIDHVVRAVGMGVHHFWPDGTAPVLQSLVLDGVVSGVGGVVAFVPNILLLFLAIAILEGTGYMARVAFIMDRFMHKLGLHGKSFIPMVIGFGCTVPAIMATRTLEHHRDRITTILVAPLMSCGARIPIYALIIPAFFAPKYHAPMMWLIYMIGIVLAAIMARVLRSTLFRGESSPFVMELPPYRVPTLKFVLFHMWERAWLYLKKAGTVILGMSIILWAMTTFPIKKNLSRDFSGDIHSAKAVGNMALVSQLQGAREAEMMAFTLAGRIGRTMEPVLRPIGFDWRIGTALLGAFAAKEVFVAQLGIVFSVNDHGESGDSLRHKLRANYTPLQAFCIMIFCLISVPCVATFAVTRRETNSWKWAFLQLGGLTLLAYGVTFTIFQVGRLLNLGM